MKTLYIDVYFLINFTVDILSLYFAACFSKIATSTRRLIISAVIGAIAAVGIVFLPEITFLKLFCAAVSLFLVGWIPPRRASVKRRIKYIFAFVIFEALVGGAVSLAWETLDKYIPQLIGVIEGGAVNRKMLILSLIVLLSIGVFKMLVSLFSNVETEGCVDVEISFDNHRTVVSAFVDSGNLAKDPMDLSPVLFIKQDVIKDILPGNIINLCDIDSLDKGMKKRIRLIPVSRGGATHVLVGVKADAVRLVGTERSEELRVTLAIDKEGGDFGGYKALMPSAALDNAVR